MTSRYTSAISRRYTPELCTNLVPRKQRAQGMPGARSARSRAWCVVSTRVSHHGHAGSSGIPRAMVLTVSFVIFPVIGLVCHRHRRSLLRRLERQRRGVRTTRLRRPQAAPSSEAPPASTASRLTSVTIAKRPSERRDGKGYATDLGRARNGKFFNLGLDHPNHLDPPQQNSVFAQIADGQRVGRISRRHNPPPLPPDR
jgi:hypothetical protein